MLLMAGEQVLQKEDAHSLVHNNRGILYLTNYRIVFERHSRGIVQHGRSETTLEIGLDHVRNAHVNRPLIKLPLIGREVLQIETEKHHYQFAVTNPSAWRDHIAQVRRQFIPQGFNHPPPQTATQPVINVNVAAPPAYGYSMPPPPSPPPPTPVYMRCRYCNNIGNMLQGRCPVCGAQY